MNISTCDRPLTDVDVDATDSSESGRNVNSTRSAKSPLKSFDRQARLVYLSYVCVAYFAKYPDEDSAVHLASGNGNRSMRTLPFFIGLFEASTYAGLPAWKWLFLFDSIIVIPIAMYGSWAIPDAPTTSRSRWLKPAQKDPAIARMKVVGRKPAKPVTLRTFKAIFTAWPLKSTKRWSAEEVNLIPTAGYGIQIFFTVFYAWTSDAIRMRWPVIIFSCLVALTGCIILSVYPELNIAAMMAGWLLTFCENGAGALFIT
ncbi:hypothetical protein BKA61DRAFT_680510 [Leptodontidium sp. MPI-SDFR-AT-0119]|nr:hypothetical protein BKA61DRAFT_680510 [Leptodontidium sp. MPI-SDFR-AT-0119]